jgi:hypothetical protein
MHGHRPIRLLRLCGVRVRWAPPARTLNRRYTSIIDSLAVDRGYHMCSERDAGAVTVIR